MGRLMSRYDAFYTGYADIVKGISVPIGDASTRMLTTDELDTFNISYDGNAHQLVDSSNANPAWRPYIGSGWYLECFYVTSPSSETNRTILIYGQEPQLYKNSSDQIEYPDSHIKMTFRGNSQSGTVLTPRYVGNVQIGGSDVTGAGTAINYRHIFVFETSSYSSIHCHVDTLSYHRNLSKDITDYSGTVNSHGTRFLHVTNYVNVENPNFSIPFSCQVKSSYIVMNDLTVTFSIPVQSGSNGTVYMDKVKYTVTIPKYTNTVYVYINQNSWNTLVQNALGSTGYHPYGIGGSYGPFSGTMTLVNTGTHSTSDTLFTYKPGYYYHGG